MPECILEDCHEPGVKEIQVSWGRSYFAIVCENHMHSALEVVLRG